MDKSNSKSKKVVYNFPNIIKLSMKKLSLFLVTALVLTGCMGSKGPDKAPEVVVKEAMMNSVKIKSGDYKIAVEGVMENPSLKEDVDVKMNMSGQYDMKDLKKPQFSLMLEGSGKLNTEEKKGEEQKMKAEVRVTGSSVYAVLNEVTDFEGGLPMAMVQPYLNKWWSIAIPEGELDSLTMYSWDEENADPKAKAMRELYENTMMFKDLAYDGEEDGNYVYTWTLDEEAVIAYITKANEIMETGTEADVASLQEGLGYVDVTGKVMITKDTMMVAGMEGDVKIAPKAEGEPSGNFTFTYMISNTNGDVVIEVPADATEFDPMMFLGGMMGPAAMGEEAMMTDVTMMEEGSMMDVPAVPAQ